jgi:hypothetical protein
LEDIISMGDPIGGAEPAPDPDLTRLYELLRLAQVDGEKVLSEIRRFFDERPDLWRRVADLEYAANIAICELAAQGNVLLQEAYLRRVAEVKAGLTDPEVSHPLEALLAGGVATCWLGAFEAEISAKENLNRSPARADFMDRRRERAAKLYFSAVKTFALVKKLLLPSSSRREIATKFRGRNGRPGHRVRNLRPTPLRTAILN